MSQDRDKKLTSQEATYIGSETNATSGAEPGELVIKIVSGVGAGKQFTFAVGQGVVIGRQDDSHITLNHNLVSRHHTKIFWKGAEPWVADLNSTNGTYLNKQKIEEAPLRAGDRLKVGNSEMKISLEMSTDTHEEERLTELVARAESLLKKTDRYKDQWGRIFSGSLDKMTVPEVLQAIALGRGEGILVVRGPELGKIYLRRSAVFYARSGRITGRKALYRICGWREGSFDLRALDDELIADIPEAQLQKYAADFDSDLTQTLLEYFKIDDELSPIRPRLPDPAAVLTQNSKKAFPREAGYERVFEIYERVKKHPVVGDLLNDFALLDSEILRVLVFLKDRGFLTEKK